MKLTADRVIFYVVGITFGLSLAYGVHLATDSIEPLELAESCVSSADVETLKNCIEDVQHHREPHRRSK